VIFGLFRLLGYQYSLRLADAGGATFWLINPTDYGPLNSLARHQPVSSPARCAAIRATSLRSPAR
jgi:TnpA family transposase